jgi:Domain of unknown function (DUF5929)
VEDHDNEIVGDDFFDDSRIQNLVNAFLEHPPKIQYENVPFPSLPKDRVVGLVTIRPNNKTSYFKKGIHTIPANSIFVRRGSNSVPVDGIAEKSYQNAEIVIGIENNSRNSIGYTLDGVIDFMNFRHPDMAPKYKVFKELFVICWAGIPKRVRDRTYYSAQDEVDITFDDNTFTITEYVPLGLNDKTSYYPLERQTIYFYDNGYYRIDREMLFQPPEFNRKMLYHIYNANLSLIQQLEKGLPLTDRDRRDLENLPSTLMICYLNGFEDAKQKLIDAKLVLKPYAKVYLSFKEALRILRKMKYDKAE